MTDNQPADAGFESLLRHIREQRAFDFTGYKRASLQRRVQRRMTATGLDSYEDYLDRLQVNPDEFTALFNTILINVTSFFRDGEAWDYLRAEVVPDLLKRRENQPVRLWSAGCASGQEAYSLAMVLAEAMGLEEYRDRVKIYATDLDEEALVQARHASYSALEIEGVPAELRTRYFEHLGDRYVFRKELRRSVIFGRNDLVQDAPISQVDVLACRNTLMYFNAETQAQVLGRLHFALKPDGVLFLGKAETLLGHTGLFGPLDAKRRFFRKIATGGRGRPLVGTAPITALDPGDGDATRLRHAAFMSSASAQVVLGPDRHLTLANHRAMHQFGLTPRDLGRPVQDLEMFYRPLELRAHLDEAVNEHRPVWVREVEWLRGSETITYDIQVVPLADETGGNLGLSVIFTDVTQYRQLQRDLQLANRQLETAYEELQSTNEELETTNEELQSTVEELETTNEELQSTNEELETMNEELQSMNDELHVTNESLRERQDEVDRLNGFMRAVLGNLQSGVVVVDDHMRIMTWNAQAEDLWGVRSDEVLGLHLLNVDIGLPLDALRQPVRAQLADGSADPESVVLDAVNRRGRPVRVRVTTSRIRDAGASPIAMLVMDLVEPAR